MNILLYKTRKRTLFSLFEPIIVEPLELEYLQTVLEEHDVTVIDPLLDKDNLKKMLQKKAFDIVLLNGYVTAEDEIIKLSKQIKNINTATKVIVSGVHAQLNPSVFRVATIDVIIKTQELQTLTNLLKISEQDGSMISGVDYNYQNKWVEGDPLIIDQWEAVKPSRQVYYKHKDKLRYMDYMGVAMIRASISCPYKCSFCYCRHLNHGRYVHRDFGDMFKEMEEVAAPVYWIVDDTLFTCREQALSFIEMSKMYNYNKKIICYLRSDFINTNQDLLPQLKEAGITEVIVGFESIRNEELDTYNKGTTQSDNEHTVNLLKQNDINLTALFIVGLDYKPSDFKALRRFIKEKDLALYTLSIWTPLKGTSEYEKYNHILNKIPSAKFDFLHILMDPKYMSRIRFYWECIRCYFILMKRSRVRKMLATRLKQILFR